MPVNSRYLGDGDWEDHGLRPDQAKRETSFQPIKLGVVAHTCHLSYLKSINREDFWLGQKH
jgi:hypothetical protein